MKYLLISFLLIGIASSAQPIVCSDEDRQAFQDKISTLHSLNDPDMGNTVVAVGKTFVGTPYVAHTLEINDDEMLVINLQGFDCTTFVENVLAFSLLVKKEESDFKAFTSVLTNIRYRDGELNGYASRLNYFTEWLDNNETKGLIQNISSEIGGVEIKKDILFMSSHRDLYPILKDENAFKSIKGTEAYLSEKIQFFLPRELVAKAEHLMKDGDIIALATSIEGLDVTHTGFAIRNKDGRIHLLHASSSGKVEISKKPLAEYLQGIKSNTGIIVARPL